MKNLLFVSIFVFFTACYPAVYKGFKPLSNPQHTTTEINYPAFDSTIIWNTSFELYNNYFSGLLAIKPANDTTYRMIFTNQIGMKFFDVQISRKQFIIHHCFSALQRKAFLQMLENDFRLLLFPEMENPRSVLSDKNFLLYKTSKNNYLVSKHKRKLVRIEKTGIINRKLQLDFCDYKNKLPQKIYIKHYNIKFRITMTALNH
jgi:hypothetical protein